MAARIWRQLGDGRNVSVIFDYKLFYETCMLYLQDFLEMFLLNKNQNLGVQKVYLRLFNEDRNEYRVSSRILSPCTGFAPHMLCDFSNTS